MKFYSIKPTKPKKGERYLSIDEELIELNKRRNGHARVCGKLSTTLNINYNSRIAREFKDFMKSKDMTPLDDEAPENANLPLHMAMMLILKSVNLNMATIRYISANCLANRELKSHIEDSFIHEVRTPLVMSLDCYSYKELVAMVDEIIDEMDGFGHGDEFAEYLMKMGVYHEELSGIKEKMDEVFKSESDRIYQATYRT